MAGGSLEKIEGQTSLTLENLEKGISEGQLSLFGFEMFDEEKKEKNDDSVIIDIKKIYKLGER